MSRLRALAVLHPFPSFLNAVLVFGLFVMAGGAAGRGVLLSVGMLGIQFCIGTINDVADAEADRLTKPTKPIARGSISRGAAERVGVGLGLAGLAVYAAFGPLLLGLGALMLGIGLAYDLGLKRAGLGWLCYAVAFPLLPLSTWLAAVGGLPPRSEILLPVAALAGPALQLANGLVDLERDRISGIPAPVVRLGRERSIAVLGSLLAVVYGLAWLSLVGAQAAPLAYAAAGLATVLAVGGVRLSASAAPSHRERGWQLQAVGIALLAAGWVAAAT
jgi:geranylgeranylglycerol-phosphate geranylgeranyltransferase